MRAFALRCVVLALAHLVWLGCGRGEDPAADMPKGGQRATPIVASEGNPPKDETFSSETLEARRPLYEYDLNLLRHPEYSINFTTDFVIEAELSGSPPANVKAMVAVECADAKTWEDLEKNQKFLRQPIIDAFSGKSPEFVQSTEGKLKIKEEIVLNMRATPILTHKAIKNAHILQLLVNINR